MTVTQLIEKYPKILSGVQNGVPKGWLKIIDMLCGSIQRYCDSTASIKNPDFDESLEWDRNNTKSHRYLQVKREQVVCVQMKEKFGGLRFYTEGHDDIVEGMIRIAEYMADNTCEVCGKHENLGMTTGWITVCCKSCYNVSNGKKGGWNEKN